jgi:hypothetical protein
MEKTFSFYDRKRIGNWVAFIIQSLVVLFLLSIVVFTVVKEKEEAIAFIFLACAMIIPWFIVFHRMFIAKFTITDKEIRYKSLFKKRSIQIDELKGFDLVKKAKRMPARFLPFDTEPNFSLATYYYVIRKTFIRPDGPFIVIKPITADYMIIQERHELYETLKPIHDRIMGGGVSHK